MPPKTPETVVEIHHGITLKGQLSMVNDVLITGKFEGDLKTLGKLTVASGAVMQGSVEAGALELDHGHLLEGMVKVSPSKTAKAAAVRASSGGGSKWSGRLKKLKEMAFGLKSSP